MPVKLDQHLISVDDAVTWLSTQYFILLSASEREALTFFVTACNYAYELSQPEIFMADLRAILTPLPINRDESREDLLKLRTDYQEELLDRKIKEVTSDPSEGRIEIRYSKNILRKQNTGRVLWCPQNNIGLSVNGDTNLYTNGFEGCLGVVLTPTSKDVQGGVMAHIAQNAVKEHRNVVRPPKMSNADWQTMREQMKLRYYLEIIDDILDRAVADSHRFDYDMTLLFGDAGDEGNIELPNLPAELRSHLRNGGRIRYFQDMRPFRQLSDRFFLCVRDKVMYILTRDPEFEPVDDLDPAVVQYPTSILKMYYHKTV